MKSLISLLLCAGAAFGQHDGSTGPGRLLRTSTTKDRNLEMYVPPQPTLPVYEPPPTPPPIIYAPPPTPPPYAQMQTERPSARPSSKPSARPSNAPSAKPSQKPSAKPSQKPSSKPSHMPTMNPTVSHAPSRDPSSKPSSAPSAKPSRSGVPSLSPSLSREPSAAPSRSFSPSADPTRSVHPSAKPSASSKPSAQPSRSAEPSAKPSAKPSSVPSRQPSSRPSKVPSSQPTDERVLTVTFTNLRLTLFNITGLQPTDIPVWEDITARFILNFFSSQEFGLLELQASVRIQSQSRRLVSESNGRNLQAGRDSVEIVYSQTIEMLVESEHIELQKLAVLWLTEVVDRDRYVRRLQPSGNYRLSLVTDVSEITEPNQPEGPFDLIPVTATLDGPSMRLIGVTNLTNANLNRWRVATIDYVEDYIRTRSEEFGVFDFATSFTEISQTNGLPNVTDTVISYNQTFTFSTSDSSRVPELVQRVSSLPFCRPGDRQRYVERYLRIEGGALANVVRTDPVQGTDFVCPDRNEVCTGARPIRANNGTTFGTLASNVGLDVFPQCSDLDVPRAWFSFNGTGDVISISTCSSVLNFDAGITVSSGSCGNQQCIVSASYNDGDCTLTANSASKAIVRTEVGVTYFIVVEGLSTPVQGEFGLTISTLQAPSNDVCTGAVRIRPNDRPTFGSITNSSSEYGRNNFCSFDSNAPSVWYVLVGTGDLVAVSTCSQDLDFDAALSVSTGNCNVQQCVTSGAYNQFGCSITANSAARVVFQTIPQVNYFIVVEGLNYVSQGQFALTASTLTPVANDLCSGAVTLRPNGVVSGTITNATGDDSFCTSDLNNPSVWYKLNGTGAVIEFSTCSSELNFNSAISVTTGSCGNQQCVVSAYSTNDPCPLSAAGYFATTFSLRTQPGVMYSIIVEGIGAPSEGVFSLKTRTLPPTPNNVCAGAVTLQPNSTVQGTITNTLGIERQCGASSSTPAVWYTLNGTGAAFEVSTCSALLNFSLAITISNGTCGNQQCIVSSISDNVPCPASPRGFAARYVFQTTRAVKYLIAVEGLDNPLAGVFNLRNTPVNPPSNDQCSRAILIPSNNSTINGTTTLATYNMNAASCSADGSQEGPDVWYRVVGTGGFLTASTCSPGTRFDTQLAIYGAGPGTECDQTCIATNDDFPECGVSSQISWATQVGANYTIRVFGWNQGFGRFSLRVFPGNFSITDATTEEVDFQEIAKTNASDVSDSGFTVEEQP